MPFSLKTVSGRNYKACKFTLYFSSTVMNFYFQWIHVLKQLFCLFILKIWSNWFSLPQILKGNIVKIQPLTYLYTHRKEASGKTAKKKTHGKNNSRLFFATVSPHSRLNTATISSQNQHEPATFTSHSCHSMTTRSPQSRHSLATVSPQFRQIFATSSPCSRHSIVTLSPQHRHTVATQDRHTVATHSPHYTAALLA